MGKVLKGCLSVNTEICHFAFFFFLENIVMTHSFICSYIGTNKGIITPHVEERRICETTHFRRY